jgi:ribosomal protein S18 acetylase RimI-like enzyme
MSALRFVPAATVARPEVVVAFNAAYSGYEFPTHLDEAAFAFMVEYVDIDLARSVLAYEHDRNAAMAMLALRGRRAWIGGMGVVPECRGRGYGAEVMRAVIANARAAGARAVDLEVLVGNRPAIRIYEALGFLPTRRLVVWRVDPAPGPPAAAHPAIVPLDSGAALDVIDHWVTDAPPWQRAPESIAHLAQKPEALGFMREGAIAGAVVFRAVPERVSILALAARPSSPAPAEALEALVAGVRGRQPGAPVRLLNLVEGDPAEAVFERAGATAEARQIEMRLGL